MVQIHAPLLLRNGPSEWWDRGDPLESRAVERRSPAMAGETALFVGGVPIGLHGNDFVHRIVAVGPFGNCVPALSPEGFRSIRYHG